MNEQADLLCKTVDELELEIRNLSLALPNLLSDEYCKSGMDEADNTVVNSWGDVTSMPKISKLQWPEGYVPLNHDDFLTSSPTLSPLYKPKHATKLSGSRFYMLSGELALLERAISAFLIDTAVSSGYDEVSVPYIVGGDILEGTGQLPKFEEELFKIDSKSHKSNGFSSYLIPTAEVPLTSIHSGEIMEVGSLPVKYCAITPCFRSEAGSGGKDSKGLIRTHQFHKVEIMQITLPESSTDTWMRMTDDAERPLKLLGLPFRRVELCAGDIGFGASCCHDVEVWLPGEGGYREISSCSNMGEFQSRRLGIRYKLKEEPVKKGEKRKKEKPLYPHTLNGSALAVGRTIVAVIENYQLPDGSVVVPEALRTYMGGREVIGGVKGGGGGMMGYSPNRGLV